MFERLGFDSIWDCDHFVQPSRPTGPYFEAWTLLAALAARTERIRIGVLVSSNTFRHPALLAKQAATVDHISNGRLDVGLGAGWYEPEHRMFGAPVPGAEPSWSGASAKRSRSSIRRCARTPPRTRARTTSSTRRAFRPAPIQQPRPPLMLGAHRPRMLRIVAQYADTWNSFGTVDEMRERNAILDEQCAAIGRDPKTIVRSLYGWAAMMPEDPWASIDGFEDMVGRYREAGVNEFLIDQPRARAAGGARTRRQRPPVTAAARVNDELALYRWLVVCRELDRALCAENPRWFPIEGEEATVVGTFVDLRPDDALAAHYRDPFVAYLMRGAEMWRLAAQVLGKGAGYNKGRSVPFNGPVELGIVPWVAGDLGTTLGTATGAALAFQDEGSDRVCVCTFGDGTANRGDFLEALNLAACWQLPIVYVCQHNGWAISQPAPAYLPASVAERARGLGMPGATVDGNDVEAVRVGRRRGRRAGARRRRPEPDRSAHLALARPLGGRCADLSRRRRRARRRRPARPVRVSTAGTRRGARRPGAESTAKSRAEVCGGDGRARSSRPTLAKPSWDSRTCTRDGAPSTTQTEAVIEAIATEMRRDERVFYIGQDVGRDGRLAAGDAGSAGRVRTAPRARGADLGVGHGRRRHRRRAVRAATHRRDQLRRIPARGDEPAHQSGAQPALHDRRRRRACRSWSAPASAMDRTAGIRRITRPGSRTCPG